jgi:hypothetical protein
MLGDDAAGTALLRSLPPIRRARDFRLYTGDGRRLTDLWQQNGRAVLGHTPSAVLRELKNAASRGLFTPFPGPCEARLIKALSRLFPGRLVRLYADPASLCRALVRAGYEGAAPFPDPAFPAPSPPDPSAPSLWRPFLEDPLPAAEILIPIVPLPLAGAPCPLIIDRTLEARFPTSSQDLISPAILAAAARGVHDLIAALPVRKARGFPRVLKALRQSPWRRRGIYLTRETIPGVPGAETYAALFRCFLEKGFLLPPSPRYPLIIPGELSPGEEAALAGLL